MRATVNSLVVALVAVVLAGAGTRAVRGDEGRESKAAGDLKEIQGAWTAAGDGEQVVYTFKDSKLTVKGATRTYDMTVTLDEAAKPDKAIDMKIDKAPEDAKGQTSKGIYKFDGDNELTLCFRPTGDRPQKFEQVGMGQFLVELTRKAEKKD